MHGGIYSKELTGRIIGAAVEVHHMLGAGLLESVYEECLGHELMVRGLEFARQLELPLRYKGVLLESSYRLDLLVEDTVVIEVRAVERVLPIHEAQLLTYLRLSQKRVGLLLNFNVSLMKNGITRRVL